MHSHVVTSGTSSRSFVSSLEWEGMKFCVFIHKGSQAAHMRRVYNMAAPQRSLALPYVAPYYHFSVYRTGQQLTHDATISRNASWLIKTCTAVGNACWRVTMLWVFVHRGSNLAQERRVYKLGGPQSGGGLLVLYVFIFVYLSVSSATGYSAHRRCIEGCHNALNQCRQRISGRKCYPRKTANVIYLLSQTGQRLFANGQPHLPKLAAALAPYLIITRRLAAAGVQAQLPVKEAPLGVADFTRFFSSLLYNGLMVAKSCCSACRRMSAGDLKCQWSLKLPLDSSKQWSLSSCCSDAVVSVHLKVQRRCHEKEMKPAVPPLLQPNPQKMSITVLQKFGRWFAFVGAKKLHNQWLYPFVFFCCMAATKEVSDLACRVLTSLRNDILLNTNATAIMGWMVAFMPYFHRPILMAVYLTLKLDLRAVGSLSICFGVTTLKLEGTALEYVYRSYIQPYIVQLSLAFQHNHVMDSLFAIQNLSSGSERVLPCSGKPMHWIFVHRGSDLAQERRVNKLGAPQVDCMGRPRKDEALTFHVAQQNVCKRALKKVKWWSASSVRLHLRRWLEECQNALNHCQPRISGRKCDPGDLQTQFSCCHKHLPPLAAGSAANLIIIRRVAAAGLQAPFQVKEAPLGVADFTRFLSRLLYNGLMVAKSCCSACRRMSAGDLKCQWSLKLPLDSSKQWSLSSCCSSTVNVTIFAECVNLLSAVQRRCHEKEMKPAVPPLLQPNPQKMSITVLQKFGRWFAFVGAKKLHNQWLYPFVFFCCMAATKEVSDLACRVLTSLRNDILLNTNATAIMGWMVDFMPYFYRPILMAVHLNLKLDLRAVGLLVFLVYLPIDSNLSVD
ncbi:hypothetical protein T10_6861 [Trichinella papuae]|uniref:Uncharacterized protein n=1 Tax=Trichinella papuae TaxID=268474 RepID=A0A0V1M406_9BILA|nr:hypothetical protein T10_6861 [Trichinella papuae]